MKSYVHLVEILEKAFDHFNRLYTEEKLNKPLIAILSRGRKACYGWHWANKWSDGDNTFTEIMIAAETLNRSWAENLETLLHEMVHLWNSQNDIKDCNAQQYHNKNFKKTAEDLFHLTVERMPQKGYALTSLSDRSRADVEAFILEHKLVDTKLKRITPPKAAAKKQYNINVTEQDYQWFVSLRDQLNMSSKECFEHIRNEAESFGLVGENLEEAV
jgi:hypothetical protein